MSIRWICVVLCIILSAALTSPVTSLNDQEDHVIKDDTELNEDTPVNKDEGIDASKQILKKIQKLVKFQREVLRDTWVNVNLIKKNINDLAALSQKSETGTPAQKDCAHVRASLVYIGTRMAENRLELVRELRKVKNITDNLDLLVATNSEMALCRQKAQEMNNVVILGGRLYYFSDQEATWGEARVFCRDHGMRLLAIENEQEFNQLQVYFKKPGATTNWFYWSSGSDQNVEGRWTWSTTGQLIKLVDKFSGNHMNNNKDYNCLLVWRVGSKLELDDADCMDVSPFICELQSSCV